MTAGSRVFRGISAPRKGRLASGKRATRGGSGWTSPTTAPTSPAGPSSRTAARCAGCSPRRCSTVVRAPVQLTVAGRTDAGVHATGQVAHADLRCRPRPDVAGADGWPGCCRPTSGCGRSPPVPAAFDARFSALRRHYRYRVRHRAARGRAAARPRHARPGRIRWILTAVTDASERLLGEHDFAAFCKRREGATTVRGVAAVRPGRRPTAASWRPPCPPTRSATRWCAAWSARCSTSAAAGGRRPGPPSCYPRRAGERGARRAGPRPDARRRGLPARRRTGRPRRRHPPAARRTQPRDDRWGSCPWIEQRQR